MNRERVACHAADVLPGAFPMPLKEADASSVVVIVNRRRTDWPLRRRARPAAGGSAQKRFEELLASWRRRKRKAFLLAFGVLIAPCIAVAAIGSGWWDSTAAFLAGAWVGMAMWAWDSPPEHIERVRRGAAGERLTARELARLAPGAWFVAHDIGHRFGNWDHVVLGAAGVFLLDSKHLLGSRIEAPDQAWRFEQLPGSVRRQAADVSDALRVGGRAPWVTPVVVVWPDLDPLTVDTDGVTYVSGPALREWLEAREPKITRERCAAIGDKLRELGEERASHTSGSWRRRSLAADDC
jgi:hypothetical protein